MIVDMVRGDILTSNHTNIVFAVNAEGANDAGFAGQVAEQFWNDLAAIGPLPLGTVLFHQAKGRAFHALVCHDFKEIGWSKAPDLVQESLNKLDTPRTTVLAVVLMGGGMIGRMSGADSFAILGALARCNKKVAIYTL